ncbi:filamentous hemagglutinin family protein [Sphingomonas sp. SORGH_AS 879]|nr:filamentous hemagglutinin family protein [Sphingomonas sp. SORGH_AS_0879]
MIARPRNRAKLLFSAPIFGLSLAGLVPNATPAFAQTLPTGGQVVAGQATVETSGMDMTVRQSTSKAIIDWKGFSVAEGATVTFNNGKDGATLNRVTGNSASMIDGMLRGEGSVYLINRNGIVIGKTGEINVGGRFVGSTQDLDNASFMAGGSLTLAGASEAPLLNYGKIGSLGGDVVLVASKVVNEGSIDAAKGSVGLLAGYQVVLRDQALDDGKFAVVVGGADTTVTNSGAIQAAEAELRAQGGNIYALAGNTSGVINARGVSEKDGRIFLTAEGGEARIAGTLTARKADGSGGAIVATAKNVLLDSGATLDASGITGGRVLVGGDWQGGADASLKLVGHDVANADAVVVADTAKIDVSGSAGAGGKAVLWSDRYTNFLGKIDASGATDGGRVETSSKGLLMAQGGVNAAAGTGQAGAWLLDPTNITISSGATSNGSFDGGSPNIFIPTASTNSVVNVNAINASLNAGTGVTITTGSAGGGAGDITVSGAISKTGGGTATLRLLADRNIIVNSSIGSTTGALHVTMISRVSDGASGYVNVGAGITTNGGDLVIGGGSGGATRSIGAGTTAGVTIGAAISTGAGAVSVKGAGGSGSAVGVSVGSSITTTNGNITLDGQSANSHGVDVQAVAIKTTTGTTTIVGEALASGIGINLAEGASINNDAATTAGNVSVLGKSNTGTGLIFRGGTFKSAGVLTLSGISTSFGGIFRSSSNATVISGDGGLKLIGRVENTISSAVAANTGIFLGGTGAVSLTSKSSDTSKSPVLSIEAKSDYSGFVVGDGNGVAALTIDAGKGGLTVTTTGQGQGGWGFRAPVADSGSTSITSAGAITFDTSASIDIGGTLTQTAGLASSIKSAGAIFLRGVVTTSGASDLTIDAKGLVRAEANVTAEGSLTVTGPLGVDAGNAAFTAKTGALKITSTPTTGTYDISTGALKAATTLTVTGKKNVTTGTVDVTGPSGGAISMTSDQTLSTQAITTASGTGAIDLTAVNDITLAAISKTGTGASTLTVKSEGSISAPGAIASTGGALNVLLNSRYKGASTGFVNVGGTVTTAGGSLTVQGSTGTGTDKYATDPSKGVALSGAISTSGGNVTVYGSGGTTTGIHLTTTIDAGGGNITLDGVSNSGTGMNLTSTSIKTINSGTITFTGVSTSGTGIDFPLDTTITAGAGKLSFTGTSTSGWGIGLYGGTYSSNGLVEFSGTSTTGGGILRNSANPTSITGKSGLSLTGKVTGTLSAAAATSSNTGIWFAGSGAVGLNSVSSDTSISPLMKITAQSDYQGFIVGTSGTPSVTGNLTINAGTGGLTVDTTGSGWGGWGYRTNSSSSGSSSITSAGAINFTTSASIEHRGAIIQTAGTASKIQSDGAIFLRGTTTTSGASDLTVDAAGSLTATGAITAQGSLTLKAPNGITAAALTAKTGAIDVSSKRSGTTYDISTGAVAAATTVTIDGDLNVGTGTIDVTGPNGGAITVTSKGTLSTDAITTTSSGDITLSSAADLTVASVTKTAAGTGASTLKATSNAGISFGGAVTTSGGALNVTLKSRATNAAIGGVTLGGAVTTKGGNLLVSGGSADDDYAIGTNTGVSILGEISTTSGNVTIFGKTAGTNAGIDVRAFVFGGSGNLKLDGSSTGSARGINVIDNGIISTTIGGSTTLIGKSTGSGRGIDFGKNENILSGSGGLSIDGTANSGAGIYILDGTYSSSGNVSISGTSASGSGILSDLSAPKYDSARSNSVSNSDGSVVFVDDYYEYDTSPLNVSSTAGSVVFKGKSTSSGLGISYQAAGDLKLSSAASKSATIEAFSSAVAMSVGQAGYTTTEATSSIGVINSKSKHYDNSAPAIRISGGSEGVSVNIQSANGVSQETFEGIKSRGANTTYRTDNNGTPTSSSTMVDTGYLVISSGGPTNVKSTGPINIAGSISVSNGGNLAISAPIADLSRLPITVTGAGASTITVAGAWASGTISTDGNLTATAQSLSTGSLPTWLTQTGAGVMSVGTTNDLTLISNVAKTGSGTASLTLKSVGNVTVNSGASLTATTGKMNVTLNSRSTGAANGAITANGTITTNGGSVSLVGGIDGVGNAVSVNGSGVTLANNLSTLGGDITVRGTSTNAVGYALATQLNAGGGNIKVESVSGGSSNGLDVTTSAVQTSGTGTISLTGEAKGSGRGLNLASGLTLNGGGDVTLSGTAVSSYGTAIAGATVTAGGNLLVNGTSTTGVGIWRNSSNATSLTATGTLKLDGKSTSASSSLQGILADGSGAFNLKTTNGLMTINGEGGALAGGSSYTAAAIEFGNSSTPSTLKIEAGTGGLTFTGTSAATATNFIDGYGTAATITSGGAITVTGDKTVYLRAGTTQSGAGASKITSSAGDIRWGAIAQNAAGGLTIKSDVGSVTLADGEVKANGTLDVTAGGGFISTAALTASDKLTVTAKTGATTGAVKETGAGAISLTAGGALITGAISTDGAGNIDLAAGADLTTAQVTKSALATGASTLTIKSAGSITTGGTITSNGGALNTTFNSRSADAATGTVTISNAVTTAGGAITIRGGSAALAGTGVPTANYTDFVSALSATGTGVQLVGSPLNAGGGNIVIRAYATGDALSLGAGQTIETTGSGTLSIYAAGTTGGIKNLGGTFRTVNGDLTLYGAARSSGSGVLLGSGAALKTTKGSVSISGSALGASVTGSSGVTISGGAEISDLAGNTNDIGVLGVSGTGASGYGVSIDGGAIKAVTTGTITVNGTAAGSASTTHGVYLNGTGTSVPISMQGSGAIKVIGAANGAGYGIFQGNSGAAVIGGDSMTGQITLKSSKMMLNGTGGALLPKTTGKLLFAALDNGALTIDGNVLASIITANDLRYGGNGASKYATLQFGDENTTSLNFNSVSGYNNIARTVAFGAAQNVAFGDGGAGPLTIQGISLVSATSTSNASITQTVDLITNKLTGTAGNVLLTRLGNQIAEVGNLKATGNMIVTSGTAMSVSGDNSMATGVLRSLANLTLASGAKVAASGVDSVAPLQLVTGTRFINNSTSDALSTPQGRWLVWSQDPSNDTTGSLPYSFIQYSAGYTLSRPAGSGNGLLYAMAPLVTVTLTGTYSREYDATDTANLGQANYSFSGLLNGDTATAFSIARFDTKNAGTGKTITADDLSLVTRNNGVRIYGYQLANTSATATIGTITQKALNVNFGGTVSKIYDGGATATTTAANFQVNGVIGSDAVTLNRGTATYADKNAGFGKTVNVTGLSLSGADAGNYSVASTTSALNGVITAKALTAGYSGSINRTYDGTLTAIMSASSITLAGVVDGDLVGVGSRPFARYDSKTVGTGKTVIIDGITLVGTNAANYTVANSLTLNTGVITVKWLPLGLTGTVSKVYDGSATASLSAANYSLSGIIGSDAVTLGTGSASYNDKNAAVGKIVTATGLSLSGADAANYSIGSSVSGNIGTITAKTLTASLVNLTKTYDGNATATLGTTDISLSGKIGSDNVTLGSGATAAYVDKNAGTGKAVTVRGLSLAGNDATNYALAATTLTGTGAITAKALSLSLTGSVSKTYDGTTTAALTSANYALSGVVGSDAATLVAATAAFNNKNVGNNKAIKVSGVSLTGADASNYTLATTVSGNIGTITRKELKLTPVTDEKVYDGTNSSSKTVLANGLVAGDTFSATQIFDTRDAGARKLSVSGYNIFDTFGGGNYTVSFGDSVDGSITQRAITATANANNKVYDGGKTAAGSITLHDVVDGDFVEGSGGTLAFLDKNAGVGKAVTASGWSLSGSDALNYTLGNGVERRRQHHQGGAVADGRCRQQDLRRHDHVGRYRHGDGPGVDRYPDLGHAGVRQQGRRDACAEGRELRDRRRQWRRQLSGHAGRRQRHHLAQGPDGRTDRHGQQDLRRYRHRDGQRIEPHRRRSWRSRHAVEHQRHLCRQECRHEQDGDPVGHEPDRDRRRQLQPSFEFDLGRYRRDHRAHGHSRSLGARRQDL